MGSYDGAESCELVGSFLLHLITANHGKKFGLYRDDGLGIVKESAREIERIKKLHNIPLQYQEALQNSGYKHQLKYQHPLNQKPT